MSCWARSLRQRALHVLRRDARGAHQGDAQAGDVERVAGARPERAPGAAHRADIGVVADIVVQEVEDLLRIVVELGRLFLDERVGRVGVGRRGEQLDRERRPAAASPAGRCRKRRRRRAWRRRAHRRRAGAGSASASATVTATLARPNASSVPRLQASSWPLWSGGCEARRRTSRRAASVVVSKTPVIWVGLLVVDGVGDRQLIVLEPARCTTRASGRR